MTRTEFIDVLKIQTSDAAVSGVLSCLREPPGRKPSDQLLALSHWYKALAVEDQTMLRLALEDAAKSAIFGFLCILDGVRAIEDGQPKGELKLTYSKSGETVLLNDHEQEFLHDICNASST